MSKTSAFFCVCLVILFFVVVYLMWSPIYNVLRSAVIMSPKTKKTSIPIKEKRITRYYRSNRNYKRSKQNYQTDYWSDPDSPSDYSGSCSYSSETQAEQKRSDKGYFFTSTQNSQDYWGQEYTPGENYGGIQSGYTTIIDPTENISRDYTYTENNNVDEKNHKPRNYVFASHQDSNQQNPPVYNTKKSNGSTKQSNTTQQNHGKSKTNYSFGSEKFGPSAESAKSQGPGSTRSGGPTPTPPKEEPKKPDAKVFSTYDPKGIYYNVNEDFKHLNSPKTKYYRRFDVVRQIRQELSVLFNDDQKISQDVCRQKVNSDEGRKRLATEFSKIICNELKNKYSMVGVPNESKIVTKLFFLPVDKESQSLVLAHEDKLKDRFETHFRSQAEIQYNSFEVKKITDPQQNVVAFVKKYNGHFLVDCINAIEKLQLFLFSTYLSWLKTNAMPLKQKFDIENSKLDYVYDLFICCDFLRENELKKRKNITVEIDFTKKSDGFYCATLFLD